MDAGIGGKYTFSYGTPTHVCIHFIFIANKCSGLHFSSNDIGLSSLKFLWWAPEFWLISASGAFRPFKVIQGHRYWYQSKARI